MLTSSELAGEVWMITSFLWNCKAQVISTQMIHLVSRNGCLEHRVTMSCTLLRSSEF